MCIFRFSSRLAALFGLVVVALTFSFHQASAQFIGGPPNTGGGGGGGRGGGVNFDFYDPCAYGECIRRPRPRRPPPVVIIEEDEPYIYEDGTPPSRNPPKKAKSKPKPKAEAAKAPDPTTLGQIAGRDFVPDEVLVEFPLTTPQADIDAIAQQNGIEQLGSQEIALLNTRIHRWRVTGGRSVSTVAAAIRSNGAVSATYLNRITTLQQASSGPPQYAAEKLKLDEVHTMTRGEAVIVALIDSGADPDHPELAGTISETFDVIGGEYTPHAHGTGMAGAIAAQAQLKGVAPKARILNVRAFAPTGKTQDGTTFDVVRGMDWAATKGARVFNLSFAGPKDPLMSRVIKAAIDKGIVIIAAAGNAGPKSPPLYPAADSGVIAVTATDAKDGVMQRANRGSYVTLAAPGVDILLPAPKKAYAVSSGTSIATAYVSGIAALLVSKNPDADNKEVYEVLTGTAHDLGAKGRDKDFGAGLTDPLAALQTMEPVPLTVSAPAAAN